ncbi:MAG TPA: flagellar protein FlaG [Microvirga sp.]
MDVGSTSRTPSPSAATAPPRQETLVSAGAVRTELKPEDTVQQAPETSPVRLELSQNAESRAAIDRALRETIDRRIDIDPKTREVVFQTIDRDSGEVIRQVPDEVLMRMRAYAREMRERAAADQVRQVERVA